MKTIDPKLFPLNIAYYNLRLLHSLDYVIGGYGKSSKEFLFDLNNFVSSYVLNENFLISSQEWKHHFLVAKNTFTQGSPITSLVLTQSNGVQIVGWPYQFEGKAKFVENVSEEEAILKINETKLMFDFQEKNIEYLKTNFLTQLSSQKIDNPSYKYLHSQYLKNGPSHSYIIFESLQKPKNIMNGLYEVLPDSNFQLTFPINAYNAEIKDHQNLGISNETIKILTNLHDLKINEISKYSGYKPVPIPSLIPILLSQTNSIEDLPEKIKCLREDFTDLRKSFLRFEKRITDAETIKEQISIIEEFNSFWQVFGKQNKLDSKRYLYHFWDIGKKSDISKSLENIIDTATANDFLKDINVTNLSGSILSKAYEYFKERKTFNRFKGINDLWQLIENSPTLPQQVKDYERIFKTTLDIKELEKIANKFKQ